MADGGTLLAHATRVLLERTASGTGEAFFRGLAQGIAESLGVKYGLVGALVPGGSRMSVRAAWSAGGDLPPFEYDLDGTPCAEVLTSGMCHYPSSVASLFPLDVMLAEMGIESYAGFRVTKRGARATGIIIGLHDRATEALTPELTAVLELFAERAAAELEREAVEVELRSSESRYRQIVTTCAEGVWTIDAEGRTTFVNEQMAAMLGYASAEMQGRSFLDFIAEEDRPLATTNLGRRLQGIREAHEFRLKTKTGADLWTIMATSPLRDDAGDVVGALALVSDVTERRKLEARIQQSQKLQSLGLLAGGVAHDFNNLLVGILGNAGIASGALPPGSPALPPLHDIRDSALRLADLTKQMLAYSGKGRFVVEPLAVNRLVEEFAHLLGAVVSKKASLRFHLAPSLPSVKGDATQLRQVVMNLIINASDALGDAAGNIAVTTGLVHADADYLRSTFVDADLTEGDYVFIEVSDTGGGMDAETQEKIFDPFFTTKALGRGLGLAAVLGILRGHRGAIKVSSELGRGTSIKVLLPAHGDAPREAPRTREATRPQASGLVLVADDVVFIRSAATRTLEGAGYSVIGACDGGEAVALIDRHGEELVAVLLDVTMPGMSGEEVFHHIRRVRPSLPVVLSSGYSEQDATSRFVGKGLAGFLAKPWMPADLLAAIEKAIAR